ncbi:MAG: PTS IIA-like nitrogen regulatory protein PtsN [Gammaproteobacteria bacterium]
MQISDILDPSRILCGVDKTSKKAALESIAGLLASGSDSLSQGQVFDCLLNRERLGSTGLGKGIGLPHGRMKNGNNTIAAFVRLQSGIDYNAADKQPVDLLFALLVPEESTDEHLQILSQIAEKFSSTDLQEKLRSEDDVQALFELLTD